MRYVQRCLPLLLALCLLVAACGTEVGTTTGSNTPSATAVPIELKVFAASSLTESFNEIAKQYTTAHPNVKITYNFNGSQALAQQLTNGATADIFASADQANMQKAGDLVSNPQIFARNKLAVIVPTSNPGNVTALKDLSKKGLKIVVAAPAVPVGRYTLQVLDKLGKSPDYGASYESAVKANFVSQEENVKAVVQKVQLGEADAGIIYSTDVTAAAASQVKLIEIPDTFNVIAEYPIAVTKNAPHATDARAFVQYILSADGQAILTKYHFISVTGAGNSGYQAR